VSKTGDVRVWMKDAAKADAMATENGKCGINGRKLVKTTSAE
jgi:hypothetical protein